MRRVAACLVLALAALAPSPCRAHLEHVVISTRTLSLGGAFVAIADDPSAVVSNPAGLSGLRSPSFLFTYQNPYGVDGLNEGAVAGVVPTSVAAVGASWFHRSLAGALSEDRVTVSVARDLKRTAEDASLSIGAGADVIRISESGGDAATAVAAGAGVLLRPFSFIGLGYSIRSINQPDIDLVDGGGVTPIHRSQAVGLSYYWHERLVVVLETRQAADGAWRGHGGLELRAGHHLALRGGLDGARAAAGAGVSVRGITIDLGMASHETLGASYLLTLRWSAPAKETPYGSR